MYSIEFKLEGLPKRTNNSKSNWRARYAEACKWKRLVVLAVGFRKPKTPLLRAHLTLTRVSSVEPDYDGLVSSGKHVVDGLIAAEVIANDKMSNIGRPDYHWQKGKPGAGYIIVRVDEIASESAA